MKLMQTKNEYSNYFVQLINKENTNIWETSHLQAIGNYKKKVKIVDLVLNFVNVQKVNKL